MKSILGFVLVQVVFVTSLQAQNAEFVKLDQIKKEIRQIQNRVDKKLDRCIALTKERVGTISGSLKGSGQINGKFRDKSPLSLATLGAVGGGALGFLMAGPPGLGVGTALGGGAGLGAGVSLTTGKGDIEGQWTLDGAVKGETWALLSKASVFGCIVFDTEVLANVKKSIADHNGLSCADLDSYVSALEIVQKDGHYISPLEATNILSDLEKIKDLGRQLAVAEPEGEGHNQYLDRLEKWQARAIGLTDGYPPSTFTHILQLQRSIHNR